MTDKLNSNKPFFNNRNSICPTTDSYIGRTYKIRDNDLPHKNKDSGKIVDIAVVEQNGKNIGAVRATTKKNKNSKSFKPKHILYKRYKTFLEIRFSNGDLLNVDDARLHENPWKYDLSTPQITNIWDTLYTHSRQNAENKTKRDYLKNLHKKK